MGEIIPAIVGGGGVGAVILGILLTLRSSFRGVTEQWATIFTTQEGQIKDLRKEVQDVREQAAADRERMDVELASSKLAEKQCREDWLVLSVEVRELRKTFELRKAASE